VNTVIDPVSISKFVLDLLSPAMHTKRARSVANAVVGAMFAGRLSVTELGRSLARVMGTSSKHAIKQIDRLLSNEKFDVEEAFHSTVPWLIGDRSEIVVSLDWTDYDSDDQTRIAINLVTRHGRATPLVWKTVRKSELADKRNEHEDDVLGTLRVCVPRHVRVIVLADRGFGDSKLYDVLGKELGFDFVIRFRSCITVEDETGVRIPARDWVPRNGHAKSIPGAMVTNHRHPVGVVVIKKRAMKDDWCLATSLDGEKSADAIVRLYGRRFTCEENFRDEKDIRFGFGLSLASIGSPERRDRLLFIGMIAMALLTLLGSAGEELRLDRLIRANTEKRRTHSLLRLGREFVAGALRKHWNALRSRFYESLKAQPNEVRVYGAI